MYSERLTNPMMDEVIFAPEEEAVIQAPSNGKWKVVIADDDEEVHALTRLVLSGFTFGNKELEFLSAYTGEETVSILRRNPDTALLLLDVVMEKEDAGLMAAKAIREELKNAFVRIILRTGQPGQAPEKDVVTNYDINDYKAKTELTALKLYTTVTAALRAYRDLRTIENHRKGLEMLNEASAELFLFRSREMFAESVLGRLINFLEHQAKGDDSGVSGYIARSCDGGFLISTGIGTFRGKDNESICTLHPDMDESYFWDMPPFQADYLFANDMIYCFGEDSGDREILYIKHNEPINKVMKDLLHAYLNNVRTAYNNVHLNQELINTQTEMIRTLSETVENRSHETASHVDRVADFAWKMAKLTGMSEEESDLMKIIAPLHDIGKIGIPDSILNKPGRFNDDERAIMKTHSEIGYKILAKSNRDLFRYAAIIAHQHHERWDGTGYPNGLAGEAIHIYGRIVGLVDVVDALSNERVYKDAYAYDKCIEIITEGRGTQFDPHLVDVFLENVRAFLPDCPDPEVVLESKDSELLQV